MAHIRSNANTVPTMTIAQRLLCAYRGWQEHDGAFLAAAIAFYTMLSLAPLLVLAVAVTALLVPPQTASDYVVGLVAQVASEETARFAREVLQNTQKTTNTLSAASLSVLLMLFGAARLFRQLKIALNIIWDAQGKIGGLRATVRSHLLSVSVLLVASIALIVWLGVDVVIAAVSSRVLLLAAVWRWVSFVAGWTLLTLLFAMTYRFLPDVRVMWHEVWGGAALGALLFASCKLVVGIYLGLTSIQTVYGPASAAVVLLLWAYLSAQAFLFGAEYAVAIRCAQQRE